MSSLVAFIIGAGSNVSTAVAGTLKENGYRIAFGSRNPDVEAVKAQGFFPVSVDASKSASIHAAFDVVNKELGAPNVVIYNAASFYPPKDRTDPLSVSAADFTSAADIGVNLLHAAQAALPGFRAAQHAASPKAFIVTGNILPFVPATNPVYIALGTQKVIAAHLVDYFSHAYEKESIKFYFASLVSPTGGIPDNFKSSGPAHAKAYWELISQKEQGNWDHRFTFDGKKYDKY